MKITTPESFEVSFRHVGDLRGQRLIQSASAQQATEYIGGIESFGARAFGSSGFTPSQCKGRFWLGLSVRCVAQRLVGMASRTCGLCGRRTAGVKHQECGECSERLRRAQERLPGDPVGNPRKASRRKPYRLAWAHAARFLEQSDYKVTRVMEARHLEGCLHCQAVDAAYWAVDAGDDRFYAWVWILDEVGVLSPQALYRVERFDNPLLGSFVKWARFHGWATKDVRAMGAYQEALSQAQRVCTTELGREVWANPQGVSSVASCP